MSKVLVISKKQIRMAVILALAVVLTVVFLRWDRSEAASSQPNTERTIQLVTGEFSSTTADGKKIEAYRFDPGTVFVHKGETVQLHITGINGASHPFVIEGLNVKGEVKKGETTVVRFTAEHSGTYPILCLTHTASTQGGPMVGYIVIQ
jgi:plastocyanin